MRFLLIGLVTSLALSSARAENVKELNSLCKDLGLRLIATDQKGGMANEYKIWGKDGAKVHFSFGQEIDACVGSVVDYLNNIWVVGDPSHHFSDGGSIFYCDKDGIDNMILDAVRRFHGKVLNVNYREYLDNGEGGPARTC